MVLSYSLATDLPQDLLRLEAPAGLPECPLVRVVDSALLIQPLRQETDNQTPKYAPSIKDNAKGAIDQQGVVRKLCSARSC